MSASLMMPLSRRKARMVPASRGWRGVSQRLPERMARLVKEVSVTSPFFTMMMSSLEPFCASSSLSLVRSRLLKE